MASIDIAESHDPAGKTLRPKLFERIKVLAHPKEFDRFTRYRLDGQGCTTTCITIEFCHDKSIYADGFIKLTGCPNRILIDHCVDDEERIVGLRTLLDFAKLRHQ